MKAQIDTSHYYKLIKFSNHNDSLKSIINSFLFLWKSFPPSEVVPAFEGGLLKLLNKKNYDKILIQMYFVGLKNYFFSRKRIEEYFDLLHSYSNHKKFKNEFVDLFLLHEKGSLYFLTPQYELAIQYMQKLIANPVSIQLGVNLYLNSYYVIARSYEYLGRNNEAEFYFKKCYQHSIKYNETPWIGLSAGNLGRFLYESKGNKEEGLKFIEINLDFAKKAKNIHDEISVYHYLFEVELKNKNFSICQHYLQNTFDLITKSKWNYSIDSVVSMKQYQIDKICLLLRMNHNSQVEESFSNFLKLNEKLANLDREQFLVESAAIRENLQNELQIKVLNSELDRKRLERNFLIAFLILSVLFGAVLGYLLWVWKNKNDQIKSQIAITNQQKQEIEAQKEEIELINKTLIDINHSKDLLFSIVSHDIRGPVGTLKNLFELLQSKYITHQEFNELASEVKNNIDVLYLNLEQLLVWSQSQLRGIRPDFEKVDICQLVSQHVELYAPVAKQKNIELSSQISEQGFLWADPNHVRLVLRNLISNALKFTNTNGQVNIGLQEFSNTMLVYVKDTGVGMSEESIKNLLSNRSIVSSRGTHSEKGTGLGLSICKEFVESNGGKLVIESELGVGTTVKVIWAKFLA